MSVRDYLAEPFFEIEAYHSEPPKDAVAFTGSPRKHPYDDSKIILLADPHDGGSAIYEFRVADILCVKDLPSPVTISGESYRIVRMWVRRGAVGIRYEPFEVDSPLHFMHESQVLKDKMLGGHRG